MREYLCLNQNVSHFIPILYGCKKSSFVKPSTSQSDSHAGLCFHGWGRGTEGEAHHRHLQNVSHFIPILYGCKKVKSRVFVKPSTSQSDSHAGLRFHGWGRGTEGEAHHRHLETRRHTMLCPRRVGSTTRHL
jgi:hypothetical protein